MAGLKWNTGKLYYSTVELGYQHLLNADTYVSTSTYIHVVYMHTSHIHTYIHHTHTYIHHTYT